VTSTFVRPVEIEGPDQGTLEGRASLGLKALAALNGFGVILAFFPPPVPPARLLTVSFNLASLLLVVLLLVEARGLDRLRPWAVAAVRPILLVIGVAGAYVFVTSLLAGRVRIPLDVGVAIWALLGTPHVTPRPAFAPKSLAISGAALGLSAVMLFSQRLFDWGGVLDVKEPDLRTSMTVDCGTAAPDGTVPEVITITYDWTWTSSSPLPDGLDAFVVGWTGDDGEGRPLYLLGVTPDTEPGVYSGRRGYPSRDMTDEAAEESRGWWHWGIELAERGYAPGHVVVELRRAQTSTPDAEPLLIKASYIHLGVFRQDVEPVTCTW
jgi:hypothetical protein